MRITYKGDYALKTLLDLSLNYGTGPVTIHALSEREDIPFKFLEQILLELKRGGFVESKRGKVGGYLLSRPPSQITLGSVIRYIDGPLEPLECIKRGYSDCDDINRCVFRGVWQEVNTAIKSIVDNVTFQDLVNRVHAKSRAPMYQI